MKEPSIHKTAAVSAGLHLSFLLLSMVVLRQTGEISVRSPYIVRLISNDQNIASFPSRPVKTDKTNAPAVKASKEPIQNNQERIIKERALSERISEIAKRKDQEKRVANSIDAILAKQKIAVRVKSRETISVGHKDGSSSDAREPERQFAGSPDGILAHRYFMQVTEEIWKEWTYPILSEKNLETVVFVKIAMNGSITIQGIAKSSGDSIFDNSTLRAITKASPVSPPPYEMEIGIRFYP